jgi:O-succinylhomoserine sulfhydrylase
MDGQGRVLGGVTVGEPELIKKYIYFPDLRTFLITFNAWVLSKVRETLAIRLDRHCENALKVAEF